MKFTLIRKVCFCFKKVTCLETSPCNPNLGYKCCRERFVGENCDICAQGWFGQNCDFDCASNPNGRIINGVCYIFMNEKKNYNDSIQSCKTKG